MALGGSLRDAQTARSGKLQRAYMGGSGTIQAQMRLRISFPG